MHALRARTRTRTRPQLRCSNAMQLGADLVVMERRMLRWLEDQYMLHGSCKQVALQRLLLCVSASHRGLHDFELAELLG